MGGKSIKQTRGSSNILADLNAMKIFLSLRGGASLMAICVVWCQCECWNCLIPTDSNFFLFARTACVLKVFLFAIRYCNWFSHSFEIGQFQLHGGHVDKHSLFRQPRFIMHLYQQLYYLVWRLTKIYFCVCSYSRGFQSVCLAWLLADRGDDGDYNNCVWHLLAAVSSGYTLQRTPSWQTPSGISLGSKKKESHQTFGNNFLKSWPIFKIFYCWKEKDIFNNMFIVFSTP